MKSKGLPLMKFLKKEEKTKKANDFSFKLPIKDAIDDVIIGENGAYKCCMRITPINGSLATDEHLGEIAEAVQGALNTFEGRQAIHIISERIDVERNIKNIEERQRELDDEFKINILNSAKNFLKERGSSSKTIWNFYYVIEVKEKNIELAKPRLEDAYNSIKNELESQEMYVDRLSSKKYKQLIYEKLNPEGSQLQPIQENWDLINLYPENAVREKDGKHIQLENKYYRFLAINDYPKTVNKYRWLKKLYTLKGDINITITLNPKRKGSIIKELDKAYQEAEVKEMRAKDVSNKTAFEGEKDSALKLVESISSDNVSLFDVSIMIALGADTKDELKTLVSLAKSRIAGDRMQCVEIMRKDFEPVYLMLPMLADNKITQNYAWNLTSEDIGSIIPFDSSEFMESKGVWVGNNETSGGLVIVDYRNKIYNNSHLCIMADTGSGKTFFLRLDAMRNIPYTDYTIIFDIKGDITFPFGKRYSFSVNSGIIVNPFHISNTVIDSENVSEAGKKDVGLSLTQKIMDLIVFFKWIVPEMTKYDESILEDDIRKNYERFCNLTFESMELPEKFCTMENLMTIMDEAIEKADNELEKERRNYLRACIKPYATGTYSKIFNGQSNWNIDNFTVLDISNVPEIVQKPLYDILLKDVWRFCKKDGTLNPPTKNVYVDECHEFADPNNPQTLQFLSTKMVKQGRGFGVRLVTATQNLPDLLSIPRYGQAIIDNSYFKLFMRLGESDLPVATKLYNLSPAEVKYISSNKRTGNKGKGIFFIGSQRVVIQSKASKDELKIVDPIQYEELYGA